jgi:hypothetical protein
MYDNPDILIRPGIGKRMDKQFYQELRVLSTRTVKLSPGLSKYTVYYDERAEWPASPYYIARLKEHLSQIEGPHNCQERDFFSIDKMKELSLGFPFVPGSSYEFVADSLRVKQVLKRAGACPIGGSKGDNLAAAQQYALKVKASNDWNQCYSTVVGVRTQPGPPGEGKARSIEMVSTSDWVRGVEAFGDALTRTDEAIKVSNPILLFHIEPSQLSQWWDQFNGEVISWVSWDWTAYDAHLAAQVMEAAAKYLMGAYPYADLELGFLLNASLMGPWGTVTRHGANISGHIGTNLINSLTNLMHFFAVLEKLGLLKYVVCVLVNGDDIAIGFKTRITPHNLDDILSHSFMKSEIGKINVANFIWSNKLIIEVDHTGKLIISRIPELVYNRIKYPERRKDDLDKWIISMGMASTLEGLVIENHEFPTGSKILQKFAQIDGLNLSAASDEELRPGAEIMAADSGWRSILTAADWIQYIRNTHYAKRDF